MDSIEWNLKSSWDIWDVMRITGKKQWFPADAPLIPWIKHPSKSPYFHKNIMRYVRYIILYIYIYIHIRHPLKKTKDFVHPHFCPHLPRRSPHQHQRFQELRAFVLEEKGLAMSGEDFEVKTPEGQLVLKINGGNRVPIPGVAAWWWWDDGRLAGWCCWSRWWWWFLWIFM